ncbi:hypothetical protein B0H14DRAFT_2607195 [Mycena olivaceomarginata]|nr:hypothetical protein B0H14DRAFT_2607195 [Mycena olivaceomarginata]
MTTGVLVCVTLTGVLIVAVTGGSSGIVHIFILTNPSASRSSPPFKTTSTIVLKALYAAPVVLLPVFLSPPRNPTWTPLPPRSRAGPSAPSCACTSASCWGHFCSVATPEAREDVLHKILVPFRLFSKAWQHTPDLVWELIYNLLAGCAEMWAAEKGNGKKEDEGEGEPTERMARINEAVAEKLAVSTRLTGHAATGIASGFVSGTCRPGLEAGVISTRCQLGQDFRQTQLHKNVKCP